MTCQRAQVSNLQGIPFARIGRTQIMTTRSALMSAGSAILPSDGRAGVILGTAAYMSPEQAKGRPVDKRSDIWAFGGVLFEMLTGRRAFEGDDVSDTLAAVLRAEPEWNRLRVDTPERIHGLLRRCLHKDPQKRLPHIAMARYEIEEVSTQSPVAPLMRAGITKRSVQRRALPVAIGFLLASAITSAVWWTFRPPRRARECRGRASQRSSPPVAQCAHRDRHTGGRAARPLQPGRCDESVKVITRLGHINFKTSTATGGSPTIFTSRPAPKTSVRMAFVMATHPSGVL
jgi:serine/threonine protein kinase